MKVIKAAYVEGKDMQEACQTFLAAYRSTPHSSTRVAPSTIMFGREIKHTLPHVPTRVNTDEIHRKLEYNYDRKVKQESKRYTDRKRHATERELQIGDQVLVKQRKLNKLTTSFDIVPYYVTAIKGTMVTAQATANNKVITRNISHFKPLPKTAELPKMREEEEDEEDKGGENDTINIDNVNRNNVHNEIRKEYPRRFRRPVSEWRKY